MLRMLALILLVQNHEQLVDSVMFEFAQRYMARSLEKASEEQGDLCFKVTEYILNKLLRKVEAHVEQAEMSEAEVRYIVSLTMALHLLLLNDALLLHIGTNYQQLLAALDDLARQAPPSWALFVNVYKSLPLQQLQEVVDRARLVAEEVADDDEEPVVAQVVPLPSAPSDNATMKDAQGSD